MIAVSVFLKRFIYLILHSVFSMGRLIYEQLSGLSSTFSKEYVFRNSF